mmetsp:Transcript_50790/g.65036  ORF Transcript_50790/g.65036 Transcript_50790/m.65036 type:complete len:80 (+) Transcript_50790:1101-1340(+)
MWVLEQQKQDEDSIEDIWLTKQQTGKSLYKGKKLIGSGKNAKNDKQYFIPKKQNKKNLRKSLEKTRAKQMREARWMRAA